MGWSTDLFCNIYFHKETYNTIYQVENRIEELEEAIKRYKEKLKSLAYITEPRKFCEPEDDASCWLSGEVDQTIEFFEEDLIELYKLNLLKDNWDKCHNDKGLAIPPPKDVHWDSAFLNGDFIETVKDE